MPRPLIPLVLLATALDCGAESRPWKNADGSRTVQGEFVKRDETSVTVKINGAETKIEFAKLHADEKKWVDANHPLPGQEPEPVVPPNAIFDTLTFDDTRDTATAKLKKSKVVEMVQDEIFAGRTGLNSMFRTRKKVGKLDVFLYFDWTDSGKLNELTLQTDPVAPAAYQTDLEPSWKELVELITALYGKPVHGGPLAKMETLQDGSFMPSHLWAPDFGGSLLLGTARDGERYLLVVRIKKDKLKPIETR